VKRWAVAAVLIVIAVGRAVRSLLALLGAFILAIGSAAQEVAWAMMRLSLRALPWLLLLIALLLYAWQPWTDMVERDALIGVAGILATVLSLGLTVTLLVAQFTAEKHGSAMYAEFRRERAWERALGSLAIGVVAVAAGALSKPTLSTAWASLVLVAGLGVYGASFMSRMLNSLNSSELARRVTDRTVQALRAIGRSIKRYEGEDRLKPVALQGLEIASGITVEGITNKDPQVVRAGYAGMRRVLVAYVAASPTRGWDSHVINAAFQHFSVATDACIAQSPVLLLQGALEELRQLAIDGPTALKPGEQHESVSTRLNSLFVDVVSRTLTTDQSAAPAMATAGIGETGLALIRAGIPNGAWDPVRKLQSIAGAALVVQRDHVVGQANHELARIAVASAEASSKDLMSESIFEDACDAIATTATAFTSRTTLDGALLRDQAWLPVIGSLAEFNLARVALAGLYASTTGESHYRDRFAYGASAIVHALIRLSSYGTSVVMTPPDAADSAYRAIVGSFTLKLDGTAAEMVPEWWLALIKRIGDPQIKEHIHDTAMLSSLLVIATYEAASPRPWAGAMREAVLQALPATMSEANEFGRRRRARSWQDAGRAALATGDANLAEAIAQAIAPELREQRNLRAKSEWGGADWSDYGLGPDVYGLHGAICGWSRPEIPNTHLQPEWIAAFDTLLKKHERRPRRRRPPKEPPPPTQVD
jgi:hypothetical protein